jgi:hypothetical protein
MGGNAFFAPSKAKLFGRSRFDVDLFWVNVEVIGDTDTHSLNMRGHFGGLGHNGNVSVAKHIAALLHLVVDIS